MTPDPLVSIIIPVYDVRPYLEESIESALNQSYRNLEILIVDDGADPECREICDAYAVRDPRVRVFHQENRGLSAARNTGLNHMTGALIAFLDSDDVFHPDMIKTLTDILLQNRADIAVCESVTRKTTGELHFHAVDDNRHQPRLLNSDESLRALIDGKIGHTVWNKLYTRQLWDGFRFPEGYVYEDVRVTYRLLEKAERIMITHDVLVCHRDRPGSITTTFSQKFFHDRCLAENILEQYVEDHTPGIFSEEQKIRFKEKNLRSACLLYSKFMKNGGREDRHTIDNIRLDILQRCKEFEGSTPAFKSSFVFKMFQHCPFLLPFVWNVYLAVKNLFKKNICL